MKFKVIVVNPAVNTANAVLSFVIKDNHSAYTPYKGATAALTDFSVAAATDPDDVAIPDTNIKMHWGLTVAEATALGGGFF